MPPARGETWTYESLVDALPGVELDARRAVALQFLGFETAVVGLAWYYGLPRGAVAGTAAVVVAAAGSVQMFRIGRAARAADAPAAYRRLLFGSSIEVALGVLAYVALVTYLFVADTRSGGGLVADLLGPQPPLPAVYVMLLVLWDLCYRIGTGWWAAVVALVRTVRYRTEFDADTAATLRRADRETLAFGALQVVLVPFLLGHPPLLVALVGHAAAVTVVAGGSLVLLKREETRA